MKLLLKVKIITTVITFIEICWSDWSWMVIWSYWRGFHFKMNSGSYSWGVETFKAELPLWYCAMLLWREEKWTVGNYLGDNCIQNFHLGRYIVGYTVRNLVLRRRLRVAVKLNFWPYIRRYTRRRKTKFLTVFPMIYLPKWKFWIWLSPF